MAPAGSHRSWWVVGALAAGIAIALAPWRRDAAPPPSPATAPATDALANAVAMPRTPGAADRVPQADSAGPVALRGIVRMAHSHTPVSGGSLVAEFVDCAAAGLEPQTLLDRAVEELVCEPRASALGADGEYALELPHRAVLVRIKIEPPAPVQLPGEPHAIRFGAFEHREITVREVVAGSEWRRDFEVERGRTLAGFVVDPDGGPVPSALVRWTRDWMPYDPCAAYTDAKGAFAVAGLPSIPGRETEGEGEQWRVRVSCEGYQERELALPPEPKPGPLLIELTRAVLVAGRVVDPLGRGVATVTVVAAARDSQPSPIGQSLAHVASTTTAVDGAFRFSIAPAAHLSLRAEGSHASSSRPDAYEWGVAVLPDIEALRPVHDLRLELQPMATFHVLATAPDGTAVADRDLIVLVKTVDGWRRLGARFHAAPLLEHEVQVLAPPPVSDTRSPASRENAKGSALRGRTTCVASRVDGGVVDVHVALQTFEFEPPPAWTPKIEGEQQFTSGLDVPGPHACFVRDLAFVDANTGQRLAGRRYELTANGSSGSATTTSYGRVRLEMGPGLVELMIHVDGYRPRGFRIDNPVTGCQETELRFQPAR